MSPGGKAPKSPYGKITPGFAGGSSIKVDLHSHTSRSDGKLSPEELIDLAAKNGVRVLGITDHDLFPDEDILSYGKAHGVYVMPGTAELDAEWRTAEGKRIKLDILPAMLSPSAIARLDKLIEDAIVPGRKENAARLLGALKAEYGIGATPEEEKKMLRGRGVTKGDMSRILFDSPANKAVFKGIENRYGIGISSPSDLRQKIMNAVKPSAAGRDKEEKMPSLGRHRTPLAEYWKAIGEDGFLAIAHPANTEFYGGAGKAPTNEELEGIVGACDKTRTAIEVYHPRHTLEDMGRLRLFAKEHGLATTIGSDFHSGRTELEFDPAEAYRMWTEDLEGRPKGNKFAEALYRIYVRYAKG